MMNPPTPTESEGGDLVDDDVEPEFEEGDRDPDGDVA
jgi:hypothetical protein